MWSCPRSHSGRRFRWATEYPTADYLYCLGATDQYNQFAATWTYGAVSMPLKFFIFQSSDTPTNRAAWLKTTPESWLAMQSAWDLWQASQADRPKIKALKLAA